MLWVEKKKICLLRIDFAVSDYHAYQTDLNVILEKKIDLKKRESFFAGQYVKAPSFSLDLSVLTYLFISQKSFEQ